MKQVEIISENENYSAVDIGDLDKLNEYEMIHPKLKTKIEGKVFLKSHTKSTGTEISLTTIPPKTPVSYFHIHRKVEETYIFIKGEGEFQVDDDCFPIKEGSVVRVSPNGKRCINNTSENPMVYMVIQSKENSLEEYSTNDGIRVEHQAKWQN